MYQFFVRESDIDDERVMVTGADAFHISNVLRLRAGEQVRISTDTDENLLCELLDAQADIARFRIVERDVPSTELIERIHLFQGIPKTERFSYIIEKATELGVHEIIPVRMKFCVAKIDEKKALDKVRHLQAKAIASAKQSKRSHIPTVREPLDFSEALREAAQMDLTLVPYENAGGRVTPISDILRKKAVDGGDIALFIGPEGGFAAEEIDALREKAEILSLGKRILRTDTAAILAVGMLMLELDAM